MLDLFLYIYHSKPRKKLISSKNRNEYTDFKVNPKFLSLNFPRVQPMFAIFDKYTNNNSRFITIEGIRIHYCVEGKGEPLLLLHGSFSSLHTFDDWAKHLSSDFRLIRLDLPGFGLTGPTKNNHYAMSFYIRIVRKFLKKLGVDQCHIAGNSLGGWIAWEFALVHPEIVKKKVLLNAAGFLDKKNAPMPFRIAQTPFAEMLIKHVISKKMVDRFVRQVYFNQDKITDKLIDRYFDLIMRPGNPEAIVALSNGRCNASVEHLHELDNPVLILWGENDNWIPVEHAFRFYKDLPNASLTIYKDAGHIPMEEIPEITAKDVKRFLRTKVYYTA